MEGEAGMTHGGDLAGSSAPEVPTQFPGRSPLPLQPSDFLVFDTNMMGFVGLQIGYPATVLTLPPTLPHWSPSSLLLYFLLFHLYH